MSGALIHRAVIIGLAVLTLIFSLLSTLCGWLIPIAAVVGIGYYLVKELRP